MGRPPCGLDDYLDWQERLKSYKASGLTLEVFCLKEGVFPYQPSIAGGSSYERVSPKR